MPNINIATNEIPLCASALNTFKCDCLSPSDPLLPSCSLAFHSVVLLPCYNELVSHCRPRLCCLSPPHRIPASSSIKARMCWTIPIIFQGFLRLFPWPRTILRTRRTRVLLKFCREKIYQFIFSEQFCQSGDIRPRLWNIYTNISWRVYGFFAQIWPTCPHP